MEGQQMDIFDFIENPNPEVKMPPPIDVLKQFPGCKSMHELLDKIPHYIVKAPIKPNGKIGYFEGVMNGSDLLSISDSGWSYKKDEIISWDEAQHSMLLYKEWKHFRDNYCSHQSATLRFDSEGHCSNSNDDSFKKGCAFKDENTAHCWSDWQVCSYGNCPFIKYLKGDYNNETL